MEPMLETIDLDVEEPSELLFRVKVEGAEQAPAKVRLVCESNDLAFMFNGRSAGGDGLVQFNLPIMRDKLKEGLYTARVEVLIENRYFAPVQFQVNFKKAVKVVAEAVTPMIMKAPEIRVTAAPIIKQKPRTAVEQPIGEKQARTIVSPTTTLKERYAEKVASTGELNEDAILKAAQLFVRGMKKQ